MDVLGLGRISVGPPYFDRVFVAVMVPGLFLVGVGPLARWRHTPVPEIARRLKWAFGVSVIGGWLIPAVGGQWRPMVSLGLSLGLWVAATALTDLWVRVGRGARAGRVLASIRTRPRSYYGMHLAHVGLGVVVIGITVVKAYEEEREVRMDVGDVVRVAGFDFTFEGITEVEGANYLAARAEIAVSRRGQPVRAVFPEKRLYHASGSAMTETAIDSSLFRDLYVALGDPVDRESWSVRVHYKPLVLWIWGGAGLMAMGGALAATDPRYFRSITGKNRRRAPRHARVRKVRSQGDRP